MFIILSVCSFARKSLVKGERFSRSNAEEPELVKTTRGGYMYKRLYGHFPGSAGRYAMRAKGEELGKNGRDGEMQWHGRRDREKRGECGFFPEIENGMGEK